MARLVISGEIEATTSNRNLAPTWAGPGSGRNDSLSAAAVPPWAERARELEQSRPWAEAGASGSEDEDGEDEPSPLSWMEAVSPCRKLTSASAFVSSSQPRELRDSWYLLLTYFSLFLAYF